MPERKPGAEASSPREANRGHPMGTQLAHRLTVVLHTGGLLYSGEAGIVERALSKRPGVVEVEANAVSQTSTVTFDPSLASVADLKRCVEECGYQCAGLSVPTHLCDATEEPTSARATDAPRGRWQPPT